MPASPTPTAAEVPAVPASAADAWIVLLTDPVAEFGHYPVGVLGRDGKATFKADRAEVYRSWIEAQVAARSAPRGWVATVAPLHVNAVPALPWAAGEDK